MNRFPSTLADMDLEVSTGPVVDFRLKSALKNYCDQTTVPLLYPEAIAKGKAVYPPPHPRKAIAIAQNSYTSKWLIKSDWYVLSKRFFSKIDQNAKFKIRLKPTDILKIYLWVITS